MNNKLLFSILLVSFAICIGTLRGGHEWGDDFASYIMQAESIWNGKAQEFVERNSFTIYKSSFQIGPVAYPWGYPLILTPFFALTGVSSLFLKIPGILFFFCFLVCLYYGLKETGLTHTERLLFVCLFAFNPTLIKFLDQILSDIPFLFFSTLGLVLMIRTHKSAYEYILLGCVIFIAFSIRTAGITLLASFLVVEALGGRSNRKNSGAYKIALHNISIVSGVFGLLWIIYALVFPGGGESYFAQYKALQLDAMLESGNRYFYLFSLFFGEAILWKYLYYFICVFFLIGLWVRRKEETTLIAFFFFWMMLLITWPSWQGLRFIFPLLPIFIYFTFQGLKSTISKIPTGWRWIGQWTFVTFWFIVLCFFLFKSSVNAYINLQSSEVIRGPFDSNSTQMFNYIQEKTPPESVIIFFKPRAMRLMTNRDAIMVAECNHLMVGDYVVLNRNEKIAEHHQVQPGMIDACRAPLEEVFKNGGFITYKILK